MLVSLLYDYFFFFQAEDGIRDYKVTGVQTCALPILAASAVVLAVEHPLWRNHVAHLIPPAALLVGAGLDRLLKAGPAGRRPPNHQSRSGERRVGEEGRSRGAPGHLKKKKKEKDKEYR